jgi:hypothetical protein
MKICESPLSEFVRETSVIVKDHERQHEKPRASGVAAQKHGVKLVKIMPSGAEVIRMLTGADRENGEITG